MKSHWSTDNPQIINRDNLNILRNNYWSTDNEQEEYDLNKSYWTTD